jgi:uncharacterized protein (DUF697 family)
MSKQSGAEGIIRSHVLWAMGGGLIPVPLVDLAAVTAIQLDMLQQLAHLYGVDYTQSTGKAFVSALTGTTLARLGASFIKTIPGVGSLLGGASMSLLSGASTYAVGQVACSYFASSGSLRNFDAADAKRAYEAAYERGKSYVSDLEKNKNEVDQATDIYQSLERLGKLKEQGVLTEAEFQAKKKELLDRL